MAKTRKRSVMEKKAKKKRWLPILAPEVFNHELSMKGAAAMAKRIAETTCAVMERSGGALVASD